MNPCELTAFITAVANVIGEEKSSDELTLLSSIFMQLGDTLATIAILKDRCSDDSTQK